jgi:hypothetical protein
MSLKRFVISKRVGPNCENLKADVQTAQHLFNEAKLNKECGIEYMPVTGSFGHGLERAISILQSMKVQGELRQNYGILAPGSATWGKLVELAKQTGDAAAYWNSLTESQRQRHSETLQQLKIEKENWVPVTHHIFLALQSFLNQFPGATSFLQKLVGSNETKMNLLQLALSSVQLASFGYMTYKLGLGFNGFVIGLKALAETGSKGVGYLQRVADAFATGKLAPALQAWKKVLGKVGIVMIIIKAGVLFAHGEWKLAFIEVVKGVASLGIPVFGLIDAIFSVIDAIHPSAKQWPVYRFLRALNPADLIGNALANVISIVDLAWTAWGRNDYDMGQAILILGPQIALEITKLTLRGLLDRLRLGWEAVVWIAEWFRGIAQKVVGYGIPVGRQPAYALA